MNLELKSLKKMDSSVRKIEWCLLMGKKGRREPEGVMMIDVVESYWSHPQRLDPSKDARSRLIDRFGNEMEVVL